MNRLFKTLRSLLTLIGGVALTLTAGLLSTVVGRAVTHPHDSPPPEATDDGLFSEVFLQLAHADVPSPSDAGSTDTCSSDGGCDGCSSAM